MAKAKRPKPLISERIYAGKAKRGRFARLLVFVTQQDMCRYARSKHVAMDRYTRALCLDFTKVRSYGLCFAELIFSAGFYGRPNEHIAHECLHAVMRLCSDRQLSKAISNMEDEERFIAYPLGRMVRRVTNAIHETRNGLALYAPVGRNLKTMRAIANG